jgi:hypothetical protein
MPPQSAASVLASGTPDGQQVGLQKEYLNAARIADRTPARAIA